MPHKILKNASFIEDDHPHLRLLGGGRRGLWHGVRGRAHPPQQGSHRCHGGQVTLTDHI